MACYIVICEVEPSTEFVATVKSYGTWAKLTPLIYAVKTESPAKSVRDALAEFVGDDRLIVIKSGTEAAWRNVPENVSEWMKKHL